MWINKAGGNYTNECRGGEDVVLGSGGYAGRVGDGDGDGIGGGKKQRVVGTFGVDGSFQ